MESLAREPAVLAPLVAHLRDVRYGAAEIAALVDDPDPTNLIVNTARCGFLYDDELRDHPSPLAMLARLLMLGGVVEPDAYRSAIAAPVRELCERLALVRHTDRGVEAEVAICELDGDYIISDKLFDNVGGAIEIHGERDVVWPVAEWSLRLMRGLAGSPAWTTLLDVGCGTGCVSLSARRRYRALAGIDLNPRAVAYARLNAALCGASHATYAAADCFDYRAPARFDHVVFAAPAGPSAGGEGAMVSYGGRLGHELAVRFLAERARELVAPGGCVQVWSIFAVPRAHASVRALIEDATKLSVEVAEVREGGLYVSREHLASGKLPPGCHYARGEDAGELVRWLRANDVAEVVSAVVTLRA